MAEQVDLTTPIVSTSTVSSVQVTSVLIERLPAWRFVLKWKDSAGAFFSYEEVGAEAEPQIKAFNKANLSVKSAERRALEYLQAKGKIGAGSMSGSPD